MGQCLWDTRRNSLLQVERKAWRCWGRTIPPKALQKHQEGPGWSLERDTAGQCPPRLPALTPVCPGLDTQQGRTHRTKTSEDQTHGMNGQKLKSSWGVFAPAQSESHRGKTSGSLRAPPGAASIPRTTEQHLPVSILPCWGTASAPPGSASSPPETHQHRRASPRTHRPQAATPRDGMSCGIHP